MVKYLLDTCIWRDFYEYRTSRKGNPLGEYAADLFFKILKRKDNILFSDALLFELEKDYTKEDIHHMLNFLLISGQLIKVNSREEECNEAKKLSKDRSLPYFDCLYAIHARNNSAIMVTQDKHFFEKLSDVTKPVRPQNIN